MLLLTAAKHDLYDINVNVHVRWINFSLTRSFIHSLIRSFIPCRNCVLKYSALTTFRKETEEGEELELHGAEVSALMNLVATDTMVEEVSKRHTHERTKCFLCLVTSVLFRFLMFACLLARV